MPPALRRFLSRLADRSPTVAEIVAAGGHGANLLLRAQLQGLARVTWTPTPPLGLQIGTVELTPAGRASLAANKDRRHAS